jgi:hypothetical protein
MLLSYWMEIDQMRTSKANIEDLMINKIEPSDYQRILDGIEDGDVIDSRESLDEYLDLDKKEQKEAEQC